MTPRHRRVLGACACGIAVLLLAVAVSWWRGRGDGTARLSASATTTEPALETTTVVTDPGPTTTMPLVPLKKGVPIPNATEAPPVTDPPSATPAGTVAPGSVTPKPGGSSASAASTGPLTNAGAVLTPPSDPGPTRTIDKAKGCNSAYDTGWKIAACGALKTGNLVLLWVVESKGSGLRALVLREQSPDQWAVILRAADDNGTAFSAIGVHADDVSGDGQPDLAFGFHRRTVDKVLALDMVEAPGSVTLHRELAGGSVRTASGHLDTWTSASGSARHDVVTKTGTTWKVASSESVDPASVPASMV